MRQSRRNESGYALIWAAVTMIIAAIMICGTLLVSRAYASRNLNNAVADQAYLTARSAAEAIASQIDGATAICEVGETPDYHNPLIPADGGSILIQGGSFNFPDSMGTVDEASITRQGDQILVQATVTKGTKQATVGISLLHTMELIEDPNSETLPVSLSGFCGLVADRRLTFNRDNTNSVHVYNGDIYAAQLTFYGSRVITDLLVDGTFYLNNFAMWSNRLKGSVQLAKYPTAPSDPGYPPPSITDSTAFPQNPVVINGSGITVDLTAGEELYYTIGNTNARTVIRVDDDHDYYIKVPYGKTFNLNVDVVDGTMPRIFLVLDANGGTLKVRSPGEAFVYIYSQCNTVLTINDGVVMMGAIHAENITLNGDFSLIYVPTEESGPVGPDSTTESHRWDSEKYLID